MDILTPRPALPVRSLGILPGSFHPITRAHIALGEAALAQVDMVVFTMPRRFPHKQYQAVGLDDRLRLVAAAIREEPRFAAAISEGGLFIDMAREARVLFPEAGVPWLICGRDAAERITAWDYGTAEGIREQLAEYGLLTAARQGEYEPPDELRDRIRPIAIPAGWDAVSATEVRHRIAAGGDWRELVPAAIHEDVERLYGRSVS